MGSLTQTFKVSEQKTLPIDLEEFADYSSPLLFWELRWFVLALQVNCLTMLLN